MNEIYKIRDKSIKFYFDKNAKTHTAKGLFNSYGTAFSSLRGAMNCIDRFKLTNTEIVCYQITETQTINYEHK